MKAIDLLIFDMAGLMFETGRLAYRAYLRSAEKYDYEMNHQVYYHLTGRTEAAILKEMAALYGEELPYQQWRGEMNINKGLIFAEEKRVFKKKGLESLLQYAKASGRLVAVASSNHLENIRNYLEIEEVAPYVDLIISGDEVKKGKPDPEIFLTACKKAEVKPEHALVLEDSRAGIKAAKAAGIASVLIEDDITDLPVRKGRYRLQRDLAQAMVYEAVPDYIFEDLDEVTHLLQKTFDETE